MTNDVPHRTVDERLDDYIAAWHAGAAPRAASFIDDAPVEQRDELALLIGAFLELAPSVEPTPEVRAEREHEPLVQRLVALEAQWWDAAARRAPWGERLRGLRTAAGLTHQQVGARLAAMFGLGASDAERAPGVLSELESGARSSAGVSARGARALEQLLGAAAGTLVDGVTLPLDGLALRGELPGSSDDQARLVDLLRTVDDALAGDDPASVRPRDTLRDLFGG
jgi:transcriptional regulator with XRE-family HTH domain